MASNLLMRTRNYLNAPLLIGSGAAGSNGTWKMYSNGVCEVSGTTNSSALSNFSKFEESVKTIIADITTFYGGSWGSYSNLTDVYFSSKFTGSTGTNGGNLITKSGIRVWYDGTLADWLTKVGCYGSNTLFATAAYRLFVKDSEGEYYEVAGAVSYNGPIMADYTDSNLRYVSAITSVDFTVTQWVRDGNMSEYMFGDNPNLVSATLAGSAITSISGHAFYNCTRLTSITLPSSVTSIGDYAFYSDAYITVNASACSAIPTLGGTWTFRAARVVKIIVPAGQLSAWQSASRWSSYASKMVEASV